MRVVLAGSKSVVGKALDRSEGVTVDEVPAPRQAWDLIQGPGTVVLTVVRSSADLDDVSALVGKGAQVFVISEDASPVLRDAAFEAGADDVMFTPVSQFLLEQRVMALLGKPPRDEKRVRTNLRCTMALPGDEEVSGRVTNLTRGGLEIRATKGPEPGDVCLVQLHRAQADAGIYFMRVVSSSPATGSVRLHARFVGVLPNEQDQLVGLVTQLEREAPTVRRVPLAKLTRVIRELDALTAEAIVTSSALTDAKIPVPPLLDEEKRAVRDGNEKMANLLIARCRVSMLATWYQTFDEPDDFVLPDVEVLEEWKVQLKGARHYIAMRMDDAPGDDAARLRTLRDLGSRVQTSIEQFNWVVEQVRGEHDFVPDPSVSTAERLRVDLIEERTKPIVTMSGRLFLLLVSLTLAGVATALVHYWLATKRAADPSQLTVSKEARFVAGDIRVRDVFDQSGYRVVVVDGSWYNQPLDAQTAAVEMIAARFLLSERGLIVRDYSGRPVARVEPDGQLVIER